jgi:transaldolase
VKLFIESREAGEIRELGDRGRVVGVTTRGSIARQGQGEAEGESPLIRELCGLLAGPVIVDVGPGDQAEMLRSARALNRLARNVVVRFPMSVDGIDVVRACVGTGIVTSVGLCTTAVQAVMAAKAGASYIEAPLAPMQATATEERDLVRKMVANLKMYGLATEVVVGPLRNADQIVDAALVGAHVATASYAVLSDLGARPPTGTGAGPSQTSN